MSTGGISDRAESQFHSDTVVEPLNTHDAACYAYVLGEGALTHLVMWPSKLGYDCHWAGYMATELAHVTQGTFNLRVTQILNLKCFEKLIYLSFDHHIESRSGSPIKKVK